MNTFVVFRSAQVTRPPALDPRRRRIDPAVELRIEGWVRSTLQLSVEAPVALTEWVALDSRAVPHTLCIVVGTNRARRRFVIEQASERILEPDVRAALQHVQRPSDREDVRLSAATASLRGEPVPEGR